MNTSLHWNAIYTKPGCEKKVCALLQKKEIVHYCPQNKMRTSGHTDKKRTTAPLFPGIIFIKNANFLSLAQLPNVINIMYWKQQPAIFPVEEIESLRNFLDVHVMVQVTKTGLTAIGDLEQQKQNSIFTIALPSIGYSLSALTEPVASIKMIRKNAERYNVAGNLAFMLGLKTGDSKFE